MPLIRSSCIVHSQPPPPVVSEMNDGSSTVPMAAVQSTAAHQPTAPEKTGSTKLSKLQGSLATKLMGAAKQTILNSVKELALPLPPVLPGGKPIVVDFRLSVDRVWGINTKDLSASIRFSVVFFWNDPRMAGFDSPLLPQDLWGPELVVKNSIGPVTQDCELFMVSNVADGRVKRIMNYESRVAMPMNLKEFPFDVQALTVEMISVSHVKTKLGFPSSAASSSSFTRQLCCVCSGVNSMGVDTDPWRSASHTASPP